MYQGRRDISSDSEDSWLEGPGIMSNSIVDLASGVGYLPKSHLRLAHKPLYIFRHSKRISIPHTEQ